MIVQLSAIVKYAVGNAGGNLTACNFFDFAESDGICPERPRRFCRDAQKSAPVPVLTGQKPAF